MALTKSGEILKSTRLKNGLTLEDIEKATKIRAKFLQALEEGEFAIFHSLPYARGFLKNYAEFLGLDSKVVLALFRRETRVQNATIIPQGMIASGSSWFRMTPTRATVLVILLILTAVGYYFFQEYRGFLGAPSLIVEKPEEQEVVKEGTLAVAGKADGDTSVIVNGEPATVKEDGQFTKSIQVFRGEMTITIIAKNRRGNETTLTRHIKVE